MKVKTKLSALVAFSLIGIVLAIYLSFHYYEIRTGNATFTSICNVSQKLNCDRVAASRYAEIFPDFPLSSFASGWYLGMFIIGLIAFSEGMRREAVRALLLMSGTGVLFSVVYAFIMLHTLHSVCLFCFGIDAVNVVLLGLALSLRTPGVKHGLFDIREWKTFGGVIVGSLFVAVVLLKGMESLPMKAQELDDLAAQTLSTASVAVPSGTDVLAIGPSNARITVVEFSDFECPYCRMAAMTLNGVMNRYPNDVRVVFRNFPLSPACNRKLTHALHEFACDAARIAICANQQGKFKAVYENLFQNQESFKDVGPMKLAVQAGANEAELTACIKAPETALKLTKDTEDGILLDVKATPTLFVNGRRVEGVFPLPFWTKVIDALLSQS